MFVNLPQHLAPSPFGLHRRLGLHPTAEVGAVGKAEGAAPVVDPEPRFERTGQSHSDYADFSFCFRCAALSRSRGGPPTQYLSSCVSMCQKIVTSRRMTATRAIFDPRRRRMRRYHSRLYGSFFNACSTICPTMNRTIPLPCLVIDPKRSVASPRPPFRRCPRQPGVRPK